MHESFVKSFEFLLRSLSYNFAGEMRVVTLDLPLIPVVFLHSKFVKKNFKFNIV